MIWCMFQSSEGARGRIGSGGHEEGPESVDSECGLWVEQGKGTGRNKVLKPNHYIVAKASSGVR